MGNLNSLLNLILFKNKLKKLSKSLSREKYTNLRNLILHTNRLTSVDGFEKMDSLVTLDISNNNFFDSKLPPTFASMKNLKHLSIKNNGLEDLPYKIYTMSELQLIDARDNKLEYLPTTISHLKMLKGLYLAGNQICSNMNNEEIVSNYGLTNGVNELSLCANQCAATCLNEYLNDNICDDPSIVSFFRALDPAFQNAFTSSLKAKSNETDRSQYNYINDRGCNVASCQYDKGDCS